MWKGESFLKQPKLSRGAPFPDRSAYAIQVTATLNQPQHCPAWAGLGFSPRTNPIPQLALGHGRGNNSGGQNHSK